jgi:hypothetical protein
MKTDIEIKLKSALISEIKKIKKARINGIFEKDFQILKVEYIQPLIISPNGILKEDYKNAKEISFEKGQMRISEPDNNGLIENMYYFDGNAQVKYVNDDFLVVSISIIIYTN